jgi:hypothetical protein
MATAKKEDRRDEQRQIIPTAEDPEMFAWLERLFEINPAPPPSDSEKGKPNPKPEPDAFPEMIALLPMYGPRDYGKQITYKSWKPMSSRVPSREELVEMSNFFLATAQRECNALKRPHKYALVATSTLKGAAPYERFSFDLNPTGREHKEGQIIPASDDDDTHRDRLLSTALAHGRWNQEQTNEVTGSVMTLQQEIIREQREWIRQMEADRRQWIITTEEALDRKSERDIRADRAKVINSVLVEGVQVVKQLAPSMIAYMTKGKAGLDTGVKQFVDGLTKEQAALLFGVIDTTSGQITEAGILTSDQVFLINDIIRGAIDPKRLSDLIPGSGAPTMLQMDQIQKASEVLSQAQLGGLMALADAAKKATESDAAKNEEAKS